MKDKLRRESNVIKTERRKVYKSSTGTMGLIIGLVFLKEDSDISKTGYTPSDFVCIGTFDFDKNFLTSFRKEEWNGNKWEEFLF